MIMMYCGGDDSENKIDWESDDDDDNDDNDEKNGSESESDDGEVVMVAVIKIKMIKCWWWYDCGKYDGEMVNVKIFKRYHECIVV